MLHQLREQAEGVTPTFVTPTFFLLQCMSLFLADFVAKVVDGLCEQ
jgi:hypothetical protein